MRLRIPFTPALEKVARSKRIPPDGPWSMNLRDRDRDFFAPGDWSDAPQRQGLSIKRLGGVGAAGMVRCRRFEVEAAADLLAAGFSGHDGKHLMQYARKHGAPEGACCWKLVHSSAGRMKGKLLDVPDKEGHNIPQNGTDQFKILNAADLTIAHNSTKTNTECWKSGNLGP